MQAVSSHIVDKKIGKVIALNLSSDFKGLALKKEDMPEYKIARMDLAKVKRKIAKFPGRVKEAQHIPPPDFEKDILKTIRGHTVWLILTYGADILSYVSPFAGKAWKHFIKWKFNWKSKDLPIDLE